MLSINVDMSKGHEMAEARNVKTRIKFRGQNNGGGGHKPAWRVEYVDTVIWPDKIEPIDLGPRPGKIEPTDLALELSRCKGYFASIYNYDIADKSDS